MATSQSHQATESGPGQLKVHRRELTACPSPVAALRALRSRGGVLLESRTNHPGARWSYVPFTPRAELEADLEAVTERTRDATIRHAGPPPDALERAFRRWRTNVEVAPFVGGWVGYVGHEAAAWFLQTPLPSGVPPARPQLPLAFFRLYQDVLALDHASGRGFLMATDWGDEDENGAERLALAASQLAQPPPPALAAHARNTPMATLNSAAFAERVRELQTGIRQGDCFQVNLTTSYAFPWDTPATDAGLVALYDVYASSNPGPYGGFFDAPGATILSASPESLLEARGGRLALRPIAGTRRRGETPSEDERLAHELRTDVKERAEHVMLVDLARNDAASVCAPGTVEVANLAGVERYRHVMHLVSEVEGRLPDRAGPMEVLGAVFPGGTVTGAPKRRAVQRIAELEVGPRGPYTGALGYVSLNGASQWNLLIRTLVATPTHIVAHAGCGIVEASQVDREADELAAKATAQIQAALGHATPAPAQLVCGRVEPGPAWRPRGDPKALPTRRVLLVDFEDSFVHNLADYCARLGAATRVWSVHAPAEPAWTNRPTHVILSPGPGRPEDFPKGRDHLQRAQRTGVPVLGVCLGHQLVAEVAGARIERHPETVHGRASRILLTRAGAADPVLGSWAGSSAARYHSLVARNLPPGVASLAELEDGTCMALRERDAPVWGLQFHPESILTEDGLGLLRAFLEVEPHADVQGLGPR